MTVSSASGAGRVRAGAHATSRNTNAQGDSIFFWFAARADERSDTGRLWDEGPINPAECASRVKVNTHTPRVNTLFSTRVL